MTRVLSIPAVAASVLAIWLLTMALLCGCTDPAGPAREAGPLPETSLYLLDDAWQTDAGETLRLADLRGAPVALAMVYVECGTACPVLVQDMKRLQDASGPMDLRLVLVTLNPDNDTPEALRHFREMHGLDGAWTLLRGDATSVQTLAALLGVRYRLDADGSIAHSNRITLLGADGEIVGRQDGLGNGPSPMLARLRGEGG